MPDAPVIRQEHLVRVGPAGWSYPDWEGIVYPAHGSRFDPLAFLAEFFDTIEINSSFYRTPPARNAASWVRRVGANPLFRFSVKLFRGFTHDPAFPSEEEVRAVRAFVAPMEEAGRLGAVLAQFPWSFRRSRAAADRLESIFDRFQGLPLVIEVRHGSFATERFPGYLDGHGVGLANIDQPLIGESIRPAAFVTGPVGYVRFHGRNYEKWFEHEEAWERYDYLYGADELDPWIDRIRSMAESRDVYVVTNNHFRGQAIVNALEIRRALGQPVHVPETLRNHYPGRFEAQASGDGRG